MGAFVPPVNGTWDNIFLRFDTWTQGAGNFAEFFCSPHASTSAVEFMASESAVEQLETIDMMMENLQGMAEFGKIFSHLPIRPSALLADAAALEMSPSCDTSLTNKGVTHSHAGTNWEMATFGAVGGMCGCIATLAVFTLFGKMFSKHRGESLLENVA